MTTPIGFAAVYFNFAELGLSDFAGILTLGNVPEGMAENIFATLVDLMVSGALGIIFAFLVPHIGSRYLWFKGWFLLGAFWYIYSPVIAVSMLNNEIDINVQTHVINGIIAGLFGIVLAQAYYWLHRDIQGKTTILKMKERTTLLEMNLQKRLLHPLQNLRLLHRQGHHLLLLRSA